jgi:hypothetical protein
MSSRVILNIILEASICELTAVVLFGFVFMSSNLEQPVVNTATKAREDIYFKILISILD